MLRARRGDERVTESIRRMGIAVEFAPPNDAVIK
jgi:hypothetical protein